MTKGIEGDWRMLVEEEPIGPDNRIYTFRGGLVLDEGGHEAGTYSRPEEGQYLIKISEVDYRVRVVEGGAPQTLTGSMIYGEWHDPVVFSRVRYDIRSPDSMR